MPKILLIISAILFIFAIYIDRLHPVLTYQKLELITHIEVEKQKRQMSVYSDGKRLKTYSISLGGSPIGHKTQEGDSKTPEGEYFIDWVHPNSSYYKAMRISYPNANDKAQASGRGVSPGSNIMIHGMPNGFGWMYPWLSKIDWTAGCIAVSNTAIQEIALAITVGAKITIRP
jgi:murein L,D-transpeptidase YafK